MIGTPEEFRALVDDELATEPNPHIVAARVLDKITGDTEAMRIALELSLSGWVAIRAKRPPAVRSGNTGAGRVDAEGHPRASAKTAGLVDNYVRKLNASVNVGGGTWKKLADCTVADLRILVQVRRNDAAANLDAAGKYEKLAEALDKSRAKTVGKLARATGEAILL